MVEWNTGMTSDINLESSWLLCDALGGLDLSKSFSSNILDNYCICHQIVVNSQLSSN